MEHICKNCKYWKESPTRNQRKIEREKKYRLYIQQTNGYPDKERALEQVDEKIAFLKEFGTGFCNFFVPGQSRETILLVQLWQSSHIIGGNNCCGEWAVKEG